MTEPLPPEGYIHVRDAFDTFRFGWIGEPSEAEKKNGPKQAAYFRKVDAANAYFVEKLDRLAYRGKVIAADGSRHELTGDTFDRAVIADLLLWHNAIPIGTRGPLANYVGGIVCLEKANFLLWLQEELSILLHGEIQNGELEPQQADDRLKSLNLKPLHDMPPIDPYRETVLSEPFWPLPMAVTWIAWRSVDDVVKRFAPYAKHGGHWRDSRVPNQEKVGTLWEQAREPSLSGLMFYEAAETYLENPPVKSIKQSRDELWRELQLGTISAIGTEGRGHKTIAPERWASLQVFFDRHNRDYIGACNEGNEVRILDVCLPSKDLLRIWPSFTIDRDVVMTKTTESKASEATPHSKKRGMPKLQSAIQSLKAVYPEGIPNTLTQKQRNDAVKADLKRRGLPTVSDRTINDALNSLNP